MKLREYLDENDILAREFARDCGIATSTIYGYLQERARPRIELARKMSEMTGESDGKRIET